MNNFCRVLLFAALAAIGGSNAANDLTDKVVVITGATSGIGQATAEHLASLGASVVVSGRRQDRGEAVAAACKAAGGKAIFVKTDISKDADVANLFAQAKDAFGHVDSVFANAGVLAEQASSILDDETGPGAIEKTIAVNAIGTTYTVRHALKHVTDGGSIILTSSGGGSVPSGAFAGILPAESAINVYGATKGYVDAYGRALATHPTIRSYTLSPLVYLSEMAAGDMAVGFAQTIHSHFKTPGDARHLANVVDHFVAGTTVWPSGSNVVCEGKYCYDAQIRFSQLYGGNRPANPIVADVPPAALRDARGAPAGLTAETIAQIAAAEKAAWDTAAAASATEGSDEL